MVSGQQGTHWLLCSVFYLNKTDSSKRPAVKDGLSVSVWDCMNVKWSASGKNSFQVLEKSQSMKGSKEGKIPPVGILWRVPSLLSWLTSQRWSTATLEEWGLSQGWMLRERNSNESSATCCQPGYHKMFRLCSFGISWYISVILLSNNSVNLTTGRIKQPCLVSI